MAPVRAVVLSALVFASVLTGACFMALPIEWWLWSPHPLARFPQGVAIEVGSLHNPSVVALFVAVFTEWLIAGAVVTLLARAIKRRIQRGHAT